MIGPLEWEDTACIVVLVNVPEPQQIVDEMARLTRPGGVVALHEAVAFTQRVDPPHPAQDRLVGILASASARQGIDRNLGLRAPRMLRAAGVTHIEVVPLVHVYRLATAGAVSSSTSSRTRARESSRTGSQANPS